MSNETQNLPHAVALFDYFTKPQPVSQAHTGYIAQLEHAVLVLTTEVYVLTNAKPYIYDEPTRKAARERLEAFFSAAHKRADAGAYDSEDAAHKLVAIVGHFTHQIRQNASELRMFATTHEDRQLGIEMAKLLRSVINAQFSALAEFTGYAMPALLWQLIYGNLTGNTVNATRRQEIVNELDGWSENDRDEVHETLQDNDYLVCDDCGEWAHTDTIRTPYDSSDSVCQSCIDNNYVYSEHYDEYIHQDVAVWARNEDGDEVRVHEDDDNFNWDDDEDCRVHYNYNRKPQLLGSYHSRARVGKQPFIHSDWTKQNNRFMGVELEVEVKDGDIDDHVTALNDKLNDGEVGKRVYFEADGSLTHGFEIITNPMGLDSHRELWSALQDLDLISGMRSHNTSTCGLHVHVSRNNMHTMQINKMNVFLNHPDNQALVKAIARRYDVNYARIAQKRLSTAHKYDVERRDALNITNDRTVEFRIFKGTLKYDTLIAAIEFANAVVNFTMPASPAGFDLSTQRFIDFIDSPAQRSDTKYLRANLKRNNFMS